MSGISAQGTVIKLGGVIVDNITGWSGFGSEADMTETTSIDSANDHDEWIKVLIRSGETTLDMNYAKASFAAIETLVKDLTATTLVITTRSPDSKIYTTACDVTSNKMTGSSGDKISASVGIKLSGSIVATDVT